MDSETDGRAYLKIEPLHATALVYETGDADPTPASTPVPTPNRFEAIELRHRFLAYDPDDMSRASVVREWTAQLRLKHQLHNRGDHYELELLALPKANGVVIRYTTDGSAPTSAGAAVYDGPIRVSGRCRVVCAVAVAPSHALSSKPQNIPIPQKGEEERSIVPTAPAKWNQQIKLDDAGSVWDLINRLEGEPEALAFDIALTAESGDGAQNVEYSGALDGGYDAAALRGLAEKLQDLVGGNTLRMTIGALSFPSGQALLDWLKTSRIPFDLSKVTQ